MLVYIEQYNSKTDAMAREKQLKTCRGRVYVWTEVKNYLHESGG